MAMAEWNGCGAGCVEEQGFKFAELPCNRSPAEAFKDFLLKPGFFWMELDAGTAAGWIALIVCNVPEQKLLNFEI